MWSWSSPKDNGWMLVRWDPTVPESLVRICRQLELPARFVELTLSRSGKIFFKFLYLHHACPTLQQILLKFFNNLWAILLTHWQAKWKHSQVANHSRGDKAAMPDWMAIPIRSTLDPGLLLIVVHLTITVDRCLSYWFLFNGLFFINTWIRLGSWKGNLYWLLLRDFYRLEWPFYQPNNWQCHSTDRLTNVYNQCDYDRIYSNCIL